MQPRVFVSSVMDGFEEFRQAAREGIAAGGGYPFLIEDNPSLTTSSRTACLDGVAGCDIFVIIVGHRGGWTTSSGKVVVEEELDEAYQRKIPILAFLQDTPRDDTAQRLATRLSDYDNGYFLKTFTSPDQLRSAVTQAVEPLARSRQFPQTSVSLLQDRIRNPYIIGNEASIRFIIAPERRQEIIDPVKLGSAGLERQLQEIAHAANVGLFSFNLGNKTTVDVDEIILHQGEPRDRRGPVNEVRIAVTTHCLVTLDLNVSRLRDDERQQPMASMVVLESDIANRLRSCFEFADDLYNTLDAGRRFDPLLYNVCLINIGSNTLSEQIPAKVILPMRSRDKVIPAFDEFRSIARFELAKPNDQIEGALVLFHRRLARMQTY